MKRAAIIALAIAGLFCCCASTSSQGLLILSDWTKFHARDVQSASRKFGLSVADIQKLIHAVGREGNDEDQYMIQRIDASSLKQHSQILLALTDFGTSHALEVNVINVRNSDFVEVWSTREIPEWNSCPSMDLSTDSMLGNAAASANPTGEIIVKLPIKEEGWELLVATFVWTGKTYKLARVREFLQGRWSGKDWELEGSGRLRTCAQK
jgi:hypothetical protein